MQRHIWVSLVIAALASGCKDPLPAPPIYSALRWSALRIERGPVLFSPPEDLLRPFLGCYAVALSRLAVRPPQWPEEVQFTLTATRDDRMGMVHGLAVRSDLPAPRRPTWSLMDAFTAGVSWPRGDIPHFEVLIERGPSGLLVRGDARLIRMTPCGVGCSCSPA